MTSPTFQALAKTLQGSKLLCQCLMASPHIEHGEKPMVIQVVHNLIVDPMWHRKALDLLQKFEHDEIAPHVEEILSQKEHLIPHSTREHLIDLMRKHQAVPA